MSPYGILALGFLLGLRHAFDPDHLVAVTTVVSEYRSPLRAIWVGISWGLGHTTTLLLVGLFLIVVKVPMPEAVATILEGLVGAMLIVLGVQVFWRMRRHYIHLHTHAHDEKVHAHFHSHAGSPEHSHHAPGLNQFARQMVAAIIPGEHRAKELRSSLKPFFRVKSYIIGTVHGLAGSAALMLLVVATIESQWLGVWYIALFGLGSIGAMGAVTLVLAMPFSGAMRLPWFHLASQSAAGTAGILFGLYLIHQFWQAI